MYLKHISLTNFRNFTRLDLDFPRRVIVLVGSNAQGKTSLLEAVYYMAAFTSFQTHSDRQLVNFLAAREARKQVVVGRLVIDYQRAKSDHRLEARLIMEPSGVNGMRLRKEVLVDEVKRPLHDSIGKFNAVIFVPQMSQILEGSPEERRRYLNLTISQTNPAYVRTLSEYNQALSQRNALLKALNDRRSGASASNGGNAQQLGVWDEALARLGAKIILWRIQAVQEIERLAARIHHELTRGKEVLRLSYQPAYDPLPKPQGQLGLEMDTPVDRSGLELEDIREGFIESLTRLRKEEIARGMTTIGPHRDELRFLANSVDLGHYGSRGQIRTALLAVKMAEVHWMKEHTGEWPLILLDEVMAELDLERRADLIKYLGESEQVLFTTTDLNLFPAEFAAKAVIWDLKDGNVSRRKAKG
ncbi:MAG: DNA replication/repair protein RecF [Anaerolineae bacterium]|nr:DNA replication/repair protein RecF [Anaerolineae bacterium]MDK1081415.1 DNA replication/repair protein RecF [Anaerolineae bacterium]MDK1118881.1 DNA replication/repair protein RecF [Anaerolineae bacterium]